MEKNLFSISHPEVTVVNIVALFLDTAILQNLINLKNCLNHIMSVISAGKLKVDQIDGIVFGVILVALILAALFYIYYRCKKKRTR